MGVGASAGGLEVLRALFHSIVPDTGMAFVVVQHLKSDQESHLAEILAQSTKMQVKTIENGVQIEPNTVYVTPPAADVVLSGDFLNLHPRGESPVHHLGIDFFFSSLSQSRKSKAIGVILSGAGSDGTVGLKAIKSEGGITIAQDPKTARFDGMPQSAIATGVADLILDPEAIAQELGRLAKHPYTVAALQPHLIDPEGDRPEPPLEFEESSILDQIFGILLKHTKIDFSLYKISTIRRRIERQMMLRKIETIEKYAEHLRKNSDEVKALYEDIFIHVTDFFRDPEAFDAIREKVFPALVKDRAMNSPIRIWVPGCATGEEAYSLAMALTEYLESRALSIPFNLFAGDISEPALLKARKGVYADYQMKNVSPGRLERFFEKVNGGYKVSKAIRDCCIFSRHDVTSNPPIPKVDLISCRNVMIYFSSSLQKRVFPVFHYALNAEGFLWLGRAENPDSSSKLFSTVDNLHKIFSKVQSASPIQPRFSTSTYSSLYADASSPRPADYLTRTTDTIRNADQIMLFRYSPPSVVVDCNFDVVQFRGRTVPYLEPAPGVANYNLLKMANPDILPHLRVCLQAAKKQGTQVRKEDILFEFEGKTRRVSIDASPLNPVASVKDLQLLVVFEDPTASNIARSKVKSTPKLKLSKKRDPDQLETLAQYNTQLLQELEATREYQQSLIEEYETAQEELTSANEELRSTNEELQSTNEELHSTNEELGTAKEELQAANEELLRTNSEVQKRNSALENALRDLERSEQRFRMMIENVKDYAIFMLDPEGRVSTWNEGARHFKGYAAHEIIGQHFSKFYPDEDKDWKPKMELEEATRVGRFEDLGWRIRKDGSRFWANVVITAIRDSNGMLIGFAKITRDLTERKKAEEQLRNANESLEKQVSDRTLELQSAMLNLRLIADSLPALISFVDRDLRYQFVNLAYEKWFNRSREATLGRTMAEVLGKNAFAALKPMIEKALSGEEIRFETEIAYREGGTRWVEGAYIPRCTHDGQVEGFVVLVHDITERKRSEEHLRDSEERLRLALDAAKMGVYERDLRTGKVVWSPHAKVLLGYASDELDEDFEAFLKRMHPEDRLRFQQEAMLAAQEGRSVDIEYRYRHPSGQIRWIHAFGKGVLDAHGKPFRAIGVLQDITEQKWTEQAVEIERTKLRSLLLQAPAIFSVTSGPEHVFEIFNNEARKTIGGRDCTGLPIRKALPELEGHGFFEALDQVYRTGAPIFLKENPANLVQPDGSAKIHYFNVVYYPWRNTDGSVGGIMNVSIDVTEQVLARKRLEEAVRARDEFLSIASHELKTPLTSLKLQTQMRKRSLARRDELAFRFDRLESMFEGDARQISRISRLIDDMLDISRITTGRLAIQPQELDICELTHEIVERYRPQFEELGGDLVLKSCASVVGRWDSGRLEQVISNLLMNALKYGGNKPVEVTLEKERKKVILKVKDQGIGIAKENQERIFQRFERAISANEVSGLGLGLYIAKEIVEMHGGHIWVKSSLGKGSTFVVELPVASQ